MGIKVSNNAYGILAASITDSATTLSLNSGEGARFPTLGGSDYFYLTLIDTSNNIEIVKVTARASDTMTIVRAQDGTTAKAYAVNSRAELRPVAALFDSKQDTLPVGTVGQVLVFDGTKWVAGSAPGFPSGTRMSFQQTAAPTGWTKDTNAAIDDSILRLVTGSVSSGGSVGYSAKSIGATTLSTAQIPSHTHAVYRGSIPGQFTPATAPYLANGGSGDTSGATTGTGGGGSHTHSFPDIKYYDFIIASKD